MSRRVSKGRTKPKNAGRRFVVALNLYGLTACLQRDEAESPGETFFADHNPHARASRFPSVAGFVAFERTQDASCRTPVVRHHDDALVGATQWGGGGGAGSDHHAKRETEQENQARPHRDEIRPGRFARKEIVPGAKAKAGCQLASARAKIAADAVRRIYQLLLGR
jgi:hypothetical protein